MTTETETDTEITESEIREAADKIRSGADVDLSDVLCLVSASFERDQPVAPDALIEAVIAKHETDRDYANGGADQFVWNHGAEIARRYGEAWRRVGAIENGDLLVRLAGELDAHMSEVGDESMSDDPVRRFLEYRKRVSGPFFGIPEPGEELAEALVEWAIEHADEIPR